MAVHVEHFVGTADFSQIQAALKKTEKAMIKVGAATKIATTAFISASTAIAGMAKATADTRNAINDMAARTGLAAKTLAGLKLAAEGSGRGFQDLNEVLNPLVARMKDVSAGSQAAEDTFRAFGVSLRDAEGGLVSNDEALSRIVDRLQAIDDPAERARTAVGLLGESGGKLNQILGSGDLDAFIDQAERFGAGVGPEAAASAANMQRSIADLSLIVEGATADFSDFFTVGQKFDNFNLGLVYAIELARAFGQVIEEALINNMRAFEAAMDGDIESMQMFIGNVGTMDDAIDEVNKRAEGATRAFFDNREALRGAGAATDAVATSTANLTEEKAAEKAAVEAATQAQKDAEQTLRDQLSALQELASISNEAAASQATDIERLAAARDEELARLRDLELELSAFPGIEENVAQARLAVNMEYQSAVDDLNAKAAESAKKLRDEEIKEERAKAAEMIAIGGEIVGSVIDGIDTIGKRRIENNIAEIDGEIARLESKKELTKNELRALFDLNQEKKRLAKQAFLADKAASLASIAVNTGVAILQAAAAAPPPINVPLIAAMATLGAVQAATVAATPPPKFHTGGVIEPLAPDEMAATVQAGESVLTQQATRDIGRDGVNALNRGGGMDGGTLRAILEVLQRMERERMRSRNADSARFGRSGTPGITRGFGGL